MTIPEIDALVASFGLPYSYYQFPDSTGQEPPFVCWLLPGSSDFYADDTNYQSIRPLAVELYTDTRDFAAEERIGAALNAAGLPYRMETDWIDDERMHVTIYHTEVVING